MRERVCGRESVVSDVMCVCVRERMRERVCGRESVVSHVMFPTCVCERERDSPPVCV